MFLMVVLVTAKQLNFPYNYFYVCEALLSVSTQISKGCLFIEEFSWYILKTKSYLNALIL